MFDLFQWMVVPEFTRLLAIDDESIAQDRRLCSVDNIVLNAGVGGATLGTDDISGVHYEIIKVGFGALESLTLVSTSNGLPVDLRTNNLSGNLNVNIAASAVTQAISGTVTADAGSGTFAVQDTASLVDDAAFSPGTSRVISVGFTFDDVTPDSVNEGDIGAARMSANRNIYTQLRDAAGNERGVNINAANQLTVSVDSIVALAAGNNNIGDVDIASFAGGAIVEVQGDVAHDAAAAGNPILLGAYASAAAPSDVSADADAVRLWALRNGSPVVNIAVGGTLITGDGTNGLDVDVTRVQGTVTIAGAVTNTVLSVVGGGTEAAAQRVTIANDSTGVLSVDDNGASLTVDGTITANAGSGTFATSDTATLVDDAAFTPATSRVLMIGATADEVTPDSVNEGDGGALRMSLNRNLYTAIRDAAGNERGANVDATNRLSVSVDNTATVTIGSLPNEGQQTMANSISVAISSDQANVPVSQATASSLNAQVVGSIAHDGADSGNPVKIGGVARTANPTAVAASDRADLFMDDLGKAVVYPIAPRDRIVASARLSLTSTTETTLLAATASTFHDLVMLMISNESATECRIDFRDTTGGTVLFSIDLAADGGGAIVPFRVPFPQTTVNTAWTAQLSAAVSTVYITGLFVDNN